MLEKISHIANITAILLIFIIAWLLQTGFEWIFGIIFLIALFIIRVLLGEINRKAEILFICSVIAILVLTVIQMVI